MGSNMRQSTQFPINPGTGSAGGIPQKLNWIKVGDRIRVKHPTQGEFTLYVLGRIVYDELWQQARGAQNPWVPTGSAFCGYYLETNRFLLNWQNRFYLLEEFVSLTNDDIQRDFTPHARKFAQSDQKETVYFAYPPASWKIDDIGKFRIQGVEGTGIPGGNSEKARGAVGRFIHSSGSESRALVVEDYENAGGQDCAWIGYQISEEDIKK
jgi:hypothetical protein